MGLRLFALVAAVSLPLLPLTAGPARAAPQILAALEVQEGMPLRCDGGQCVTDLTTFCLQQDRPAPPSGTVYNPATAEHFVLRLTAADGSVRQVPAFGASFTSNRGFTRVRVSLPETQLAALGATQARLVVTRQASLIPEDVPGDPRPITRAEADYVTKSLRRMGEAAVDQRPLATSARLVGRVATAITDGRLPATPDNVERLWRDVVDDMAPVLQGKDAAISGARRELDRCATPGIHYSLAGVQSCLEYRQGDMMRDLNIDYWDKKPGS